MNRPTLVVVALIVVSLIGCGTRDTDVAQIMHAPPPPAAVEPAGPITVASFDFTESRIVAEIYAQALEASAIRWSARRAWPRVRCSNPPSNRDSWI